MVSRVFGTYSLGLVLALALIGSTRAAEVANSIDLSSNSESGSSIQVNSDIDDRYAYDQFLDVMADAGQTVIKFITNITGYSDSDKLCCWVDDVKHENGATWTNGDGAHCNCMEGQAHCVKDTITVAPTEPPTTTA